MNNFCCTLLVQGETSFYCHHGDTPDERKINFEHSSFRHRDFLNLSFFFSFSSTHDSTRDSSCSMLLAVWGKNYISNHSILIASPPMPMTLGYCRGKDVESGSECRPAMELPRNVDHKSLQTSYNEQSIDHCWTRVELSFPGFPPAVCQNPNLPPVT